jgi:hypothetical protein
MADVRRALRGWEQHLEEMIGVDDAAVLVDEFDHHVTNDRLAAAWRTNLLVHASGQFVALVAAVAVLALLL